jgi:hypothetical protein
MSVIEIFRQLHAFCVDQAINTGCSVSNNVAGEGTIIAVSRTEDHLMRLPLIASAFVLFFAIGVSAAPDSPFLRINKTNKNGKIELVVKNVSHKPIVAYVVIVESANNRSVFHGVYTDKDSLAAGKTAILGQVASTDQINVSVDYVRLADGTAWGPAATDDAKEILSRLR